MNLLEIKNLVKDKRAKNFMKFKIFIFSLAINLPVMASTLSFRDGTSGYIRTSDTYIQNLSDATAGSSNGIEVQGGVCILLKFDEIFGNSSNQIPVNSTIVSATITLRAGGGGYNVGGLSFYRMLTDWNESSSGNSFGGFIETNGVEASQTADDTKTPNTTAPLSTTWDVTSSVAAWSAGASNYGWVGKISSGFADFTSSEHSNINVRPSLSVVYTVVPEPSGFFIGAFGVICTLSRRTRR